MKEVIYDIEVYPNKYCVGVNYKGKVHIFDTLKDIKKIPFSDSNYLFIGFNNRRYDQPIIENILNGLPPNEIYNISKSIIKNKVDLISWKENIVDLLEICPKMSKCSLKEMGHRLKYPILQNLPYSFDKVLTENEWQNVKDYCVHDLNITALLWSHLKKEYQTRQSLKKYFNIKTEYGGAPNLAQKVILSELEDNKVTYDKKLIKMDNLILSDKLKGYYDEAFSKSLEDYKDKENWCEFMKREEDVNGCLMTIKTGGLHGNTYSGVYENVYEYDVVSYYPSIILNCKIGSEEFRQIYRRIYNLRLKLKAQKDAGADSLKLVLNSTYGKFADSYADLKIYAPNLLLSICLLGQFYILDLIEKLEYEQCLIANTDGIFTTKEIEPSIIDEWEKRTGFKLEKTVYKRLILKDVSNYYAINDKGEEKRKGVFLTNRFTHNVSAQIIQKSVISELNGMMTIEECINECNEIYDFCYFSKAVYGKKLLLDGKKLDDPKVRYFISKEGYVLERESEKTKSRLCKDSPIQLAMNLDDKLVNQVNKEWYINKAIKLKESIFKNERVRSPNSVS